VVTYNWIILAIALIYLALLFFVNW